jgi:hypothetical protein
METRVRFLDEQQQQQQHQSDPLEPVLYVLT